MRASRLLLLAGAVSACGDLPPPDELEAQAAACPALDPLPVPGVDGTIVALNAYYLQEEAARALRRGETSSAVVEEVLTKAAALGAAAVRTNGFNDDPAKAGDSAMQIAPLTYDDTAVRGLDLVLTRAAAHGLRLVLPLGNYWNDYGGARQYVAWAGLPAPVEGDPRFFTDPDVGALYREHLGRLLDHVNAFDGVRTGDHPAVLVWEVLNEPRGAGLDGAGAEMAAWIAATAARVKALAPRALVGTGEEGFETSRDGTDAAFWEDAAPGWLFDAGTSFRRNTAAPAIDVASVHLYPESWGFATPDAAAAGARWIAEHAAAARTLGKPLLVGEFGLRNAGDLDLAARRAIYRGWFRCARTSGALGAAPWMFANDARPDAWDAYTFYCRDGTAPADPVNRYADVVSEAAR
ncbi:MAG TPA: cellulase family glycosylhydrolase [Polyangia bacterium]|jgi:mannan endo-1,4-beta-mannosidase